MDQETPPGKKKLRERVRELKMERRVGKYNKPEGPYLGQGIYKAPKEEQKVFRKNLTAQIRQIRSGTSAHTTPAQSVAGNPGY